MPHTLRSRSTALRDRTTAMPGVLPNVPMAVERGKLTLTLKGKYKALAGDRVVSRLKQLARLVGRENVIAGADCGFAASGIRFNDTHPSVAWLKFAALAEGARLATRQLWGRA